MKITAFILIFSIFSISVHSFYIIEPATCEKNDGCKKNCKNGDSDCTCLSQGGYLCNYYQSCSNTTIKNWESQICCLSKCEKSDIKDIKSISSISEELEKYEKEIANRKIISLINYSNYQISEKKTITTYKRSYILFIFTIFFITIFVLYLILRKENEFFFQFFKRITGINKLILRSIIKNHPNIKKEEIIYLTNIPQEEINSFIKKIKLQEQK